MGEWCELYACDFIMSTGDNIYDDGVTNEKCPPGHVTSCPPMTGDLAHGRALRQHVARGVQPPRHRLAALVPHCRQPRPPLRQRGVVPGDQGEMLNERAVDSF